jgi:hypothetical protein
MLSQIIPSRFFTPTRSEALPAPPPGDFSRRFGASVGPFCLSFHQPLRRQGAHFDPCLFSRGFGQGRIRGALFASLSRRARPRLRRQCLAERNRRPADVDTGLFRTEGCSRHGSARHERNSAPGFRRPGDFERGDESLRASDQRSGFRGSGPQVSDLGAGPFPGASRGARVAPEEKRE